MRTSQHCARLLQIPLLVACMLLGGCATVLDHSNRAMFLLNDGLDSAVLGPLSEIYAILVPRFLRTAVSNVFDNLGEIETILNDLLQGKGGQAGDDTARLLVNSTLGVGGVFDVAKSMNLEQHDEDFGQTLGVWGAESGPYIVLPLFGPSSFRDAPAIPFSIVANPLTWIDEPAITGSAQVLNLLDQRSRRASDIERRDESAADRYVFTREAYLQRRRFLIHDGNPPSEEIERDLEDLLEEAADP